MLFTGDGVHRQTGCRVRAADQQIESLAIHPFACARCRDVRLVLVIRIQHGDRLAVDLAAEIGNRHADRLEAALAVDVRVKPRHVGDKTDLHCVVSRLRATHRDSGAGGDRETN